MNGKICYKLSKCDNYIGDRLGISPKRVKTLRGIYASKIADDANTLAEFDNLIYEANEGNQEAIDTLTTKVRETLEKSRRVDTEEAKLVTTVYSDDFLDVSELPLSIREDTMQYMVELFSIVLTQKMIKFPDPSCASRADYANKHESAIWKNVYNHLLTKVIPTLVARNEASGDLSKVDQTEALKSIESYLRPLTTFARIIVRDTEGVRLGNNSLYDNISEVGEEQFNDAIIEEMMDPELQTKEGWQEMKDRISAYSKLGQKTRQLLSSIPKVSNSKVEKTIFGSIRKENPALVHSLLIRRANGAINSRHMIVKILKTKDSRLHKEVRKALEELLLIKRTDSAEVKAFKKQRRTELYVDLKRSRQMYVAFVKKAKEISRKILNRHMYNIADLYFSSMYASKQEINIQKIEDHLVEKSEAVGIREQAPKSRLESLMKKGDVEGFRVSIAETLNELGLSSDTEINKSGETVLDIIDNLLEQYNKGDLKAIDDIKKIISIFGSIHLAIKSSDTKRIASIIKGKTDAFGNIDEDSLVFKMQINNLLNILNNYERNNLLSMAKYKQSDGKTATYSTFVTPSYMSDFIDLIHSYVEANDKRGLKRYLENYFLNNPVFAEKINGKLVIRNAWVRDLYEWCVNPNLETPNLANLLEYNKILGTSGERGKEFESMTAEEHYEVLLEEYVDGLGIQGHNNRYTNYSVFILGDANTLKTITGKRYDTISEDNSDSDSGMTALINEFYNIFRSELTRMKHTEEMQKAIQTKYDEKFIGKDSEIKEELKWSIPKSLNANKDTMMFFYDAFNGMSISELEQMTEREIKEKIIDALNSAFNKFKEENPNIASKSFLSKMKNIYGKEVSKEDALKDFWLNHKLATIEQLQMFTLSPAYYSSTKDLQKRYKEIHASGTALDIYAIDPTTGKMLFRDPKDAVEKCIYFKDIEINPEEVNPEFMESLILTFATDKAAAKQAIKEGIVTPLEDKSANEARLNTIKNLLGDNYSIYKNYATKTSLTDGQGYRTLDSYRKVCIMGAKWSVRHEQAYQEIMSIRQNLKETYGDGYKDINISDADLQRLQELSAIFQPLKPYMYSHEKIGDGLMPIPVQHKYAEVVIIPELLPANSMLRDMAHYMEDNNIDMACADSCVKVGSFGATDISNLDKFGKSSGRENLYEALSYAYVHQFSYDKYRIQTNVPAHNNVENQLFGTQPRKLLLANIKSSDRLIDYVGFNEFNLWGNTIEGRNYKDDFSGDQIIALYNALICSNIWESYEDFATTIEDQTKLAELLSDNTIGNQRVLMDRLIAYSLTGDDRFLVPLNDNSTASDATSLIFSLFRKIVNKQRIKGGSLVQASSMGLKGYERDGDLKVVTDEEGNILYEECEVPFMLNWTDASGKTYELNREDWCYPDGTLKLGKELHRSDPEYKKYQSYKDSKGKVHKPLIEESFPGILSIVAYRIPTERGYSMLNLKIKRFSPATSGGTIKVPLIGTVKSGFDYDIDKLYFMMKSFKFDTSEMGGMSNFDIWNRIYKDNPDIYLELLIARERVEKANNELLSYLLELRSKGGHDRTGAIMKLIDELETKDRLLDYWEEAGLPGTASEFFSNYILKNVYKFKLKNLSEYNPMKPPMSYKDKDGNIIQGNTREARNNMLLKLIQSRMSDIATVRDRITPGGFKNASAAARLIREIVYSKLPKSVLKSDGKINLSKLKEEISRKEEDQDPEPNYDPSDVSTLVYFNKQNQIAAKVIGIAANQNAHHAYISITKKCQSKLPIKFGQHSIDGLFNFLHNDPSIDVNVAEFLAAAVDAVKDPVLNYLNINEHTAAIGITLARLGYSAEDIGLLFSQPIITDICNYAAKYKCNIQKAINKVCNTWYKDWYGHSKPGSKAPNIETIESEIADLVSSYDPAAIANSEILAGNIYASKEETEKWKISNMQTQIQIAHIFSQAAKVTSEINDFVAVTKFTASNSVGSTPGHFYNQQERVKAYLKKATSEDAILDIEISDGKTLPINNDLENLSKDLLDYMWEIMDNPFAFEQIMFDSNRKLLQAITKNFPYETELFREARKIANENSLTGVLPSNLIDRLHEDLHVFILSSINDSIFSRDLNTEHGVLSTREYYDKYFPNELAKWLKDEKNRRYKDMEIFKSLQFKVNKDGKTYISMSGRLSEERQTEGCFVLW